MLSRKEIEQWIRAKKGVLTSTSVLVYRESYFGNDIIAPNSSSTHADNRGYMPVERWIMSTVEAENFIRKKGEGITKIRIGKTMVPLTDLKTIAGKLIFGRYAKSWPLTKILDIGGRPVKTSFGTRETPPIPVHVHGGAIVHGRVRKPGKSEAYFFPLTNIPPYDKKISATTRIGLKAGIIKKDVREKLREFGENDSMYTLLNEYHIEPITSWTVPEGILHAPGPHITFEIQLPQDDANMFSWRLGEHLGENEKIERYKEVVLRGLKNEDALIGSVLDWKATSDQHLKKKYFHTPKILESSRWGRRLQIFFDMFYGEAWEILPDQTMSLSAKKVPQAGIVWSGMGTINGNPLSQSDVNEFLCIPNTPISVANTGTQTLYIYTVEPIRN